MPVVTRGPQLPPEPEIELTNMQKAERALRSDSAVSAISYLKLHLKDAPDDVRAQRWLAVALLAENRADDAQAVLRSAYRADPGLADDVMLPREMGYTRERWRALVNRASSAANVSKSASGWLLLGVLMQAEERGAMAKQMVERAAAAGLEPQLVAAFGA
jgi:tetratricopeptide (TPR) repeat protein